MRKTILIVLTVVCIAMLAIPTTAHAAHNSSVHNQSTPVDSERVDGSLSIISAEYQSDTQQLRITFDVDSKVAVTLTDAGGFRDGGQLDQRSLILDPGRQTVTMPVTKAGNYVGVTVTTPDVVYAKPVQVRSSIISGPWNGRDVQLAALTAGLTVALVLIVKTFLYFRGKDDSPERVA